MTRRTRTKRARAVFISDPHLPWPDWKALEYLFRWLKKHRPETVIFLGDNADRIMLSRFSKPYHLLGPKTVKDETQALRWFLKRVLACNPDRVECLAGNHEDRYKSRVGSDPGLSLYAKDWQLEIYDEFGVPYHPDHEMILRNPGHRKIHVCHGWRSLKMPGMAAADCALHGMVPFVQAHSHKLAGPIYLKKDVWSLECGYLGDLDAICFAYYQGKKSNVNHWVKGFGFLDSSGRPYTEAIP